MKKAIFAIVASLSMSFAIAQPSVAETSASNVSHTVAVSESSATTVQEVATSTAKTDALPGVSASQSFGKFLGAVMRGPSMLLDATASVANDVKNGFKQGIAGNDSSLPSNERVVTAAASTSDSQSADMSKSTTTSNATPTQLASFERAQAAFASMFKKPVTAAANPVAANDE